MSASIVCEEMNAFNIGLKISETLKTRRSLKTKGIKLNEVSTAYPIYEENHVYLYEDTLRERMNETNDCRICYFCELFCR